VTEGAEVEVAAALVRDAAGRYLLARRRTGTHLAGLWEFPGGKRERGESLEACLRRELREELGGEFTVDDRLDTIRWQYPGKAVVLHFFHCRLVSGAIEPREQQELAWVEPGRLGEYAFPDADRAVVDRLSRIRPDAGTAAPRLTDPGRPGTR
jgi:8-oxo-dGTP diphosphatase